MEVKYMKNLFIEYPKCSTCQKVKKWLIQHNVEFAERNIVTDVPTEEELEKWIKMSGEEIKNGLTPVDLGTKNYS